jgi:hypothetical protein
MSQPVRQFLIESLQNGFFGNSSTPNAVGQVTYVYVLVDAPPPDFETFFAHSKQKPPSTQLAIKSLVCSDVTLMKSFLQVVEAKARIMPFEACALCKYST